MRERIGEMIEKEGKEMNGDEGVGEKGRGRKDERERKVGEVEREEK